jgi:hypothetical protein
MKVARLLPALLGLALYSAPLTAADLTRIDRTPGKEPAYRSKAPQYCLLVFGPAARTRVWLVRDGEVLYVDRNGNGDLTEPGERCKGTTRPGVIAWSIGDIVEADGRARHTGLRVRLRRGSFLLALRTAEGIHQEVGNEVGALRFSKRARDAPIIHFAGPLTVLLGTPPRLVPGQEGELIALIGTTGVGAGAAAYCHADALGKCKLVGTVEFPNPTPSAAPIQVKCESKGY